MLSLCLIAERESKQLANNMVDISEYKVGVIVSLEELSSKSGGKSLRLCMVNVGNDDDLVPVVTSAPNIREQSRVAVALAGSTVLTDDGDELKLQKTTVGGKMSHGMLCDSKMLGWSGGASGVAVQIPDDIDIGSSPPSTKPRPKGTADDGGAAEAGPVTGGLFERKLSEFMLMYCVSAQLESKHYEVPGDTTHWSI